MGDSKAAQLQLKVHSLERELEVTKGKVKTRDSEVIKLGSKVTAQELEISHLQGRIGELVSAGSFARNLAWDTAAFTAPRPAAPGPDVHGIRVGELTALWFSIKEDAENYCQAHEVEAVGASCHVCISDPCPWDHKEVECKTHAACGSRRRMQLQPDTHLVVNRYVKPQTLQHTSYAQLVATTRPPFKPVPRPSTFVSHVWSENFGSFADTLNLALGTAEVLFVAGLCLNLHEGAADGLAEAGPQDVARIMAQRVVLQALRSCCQVLAVVDVDLAYPTRLWCAFEIATATLEGVNVTVWPHVDANLAKLSEAVENLKLSHRNAYDLEEAKSVCQYLDTSYGLPWMASYIADTLSARCRLFCQAFEEMNAERPPGEPLQDRDLLRLRALQQQGTARLARQLDITGGTIQLASRHRETELLRGLGPPGPRCEYGTVGGPLCMHPSYVPEVWDDMLARRVLRVHGLCLFSCNATVTPGEGLWHIFFSVRRDADFKFDTQVIFRLNGKEMSRFNIEDKVKAVNVWTPLFVGEFRQERGSYKDVEAQMESVPAQRPVPKYGFYIDRVRAELVAPGRACSPV